MSAPGPSASDRTLQADDLHMQIGILEEKLSSANDTIAMEKETVAGLEDRVSDMTLQADDLRMQIGMLKEGRDACWSSSTRPMTCGCR